jgi:antitoxin ParD1/3/4
MAEIERMTITLPAEMAAVVKSAVEAGDYASASEVVRAALRAATSARPTSTPALPMLRPGASRTLIPPASLSAGGSYWPSAHPPSDAGGGSRPR